MADSAALYTDPAISLTRASYLYKVKYTAIYWQPMVLPGTLQYLSTYLLAYSDSLIPYSVL
jgi:hypothetical protein